MIDQQRPLLTVGRFRRDGAGEEFLWFGQSPVMATGAGDKSQPEDEGVKRREESIGSPGANGRKSAVKVVVADDSPRSRAALQAFLATLPGVEVVGEAADGEEALRMCLGRRPDVLLIDYRLSKPGETTATEMIKSQCPEVAVVILSMHAYNEASAYKSGADRFLLKGCSAEDFLAAFMRDLK